MSNDLSSKTNSLNQEIKDLETYLELLKKKKDLTDAIASFEKNSSSNPASSQNIPRDDPDWRRFFKFKDIMNDA